MKHNFTIVGVDIVLAPLSYNNIENQRILRNAQKDYFFSKNIISSEQQEKWYKSYLQKENDYMFEILDKSNTYLGSIALYNIDSQAGMAEFGRIIVKEDAPKYTGTKAIQMILEFANKSLHLNKVVCSVQIDNQKAISIYQKIGFIEYSRNNQVISFGFEF